MTAPLLEARGITLRAGGGRVLVRDLSLVLEREPVALVGRNGVGKSTLLRALAGVEPPHHGAVVCRGRRRLVPQHLPAGDASPGEIRRRHLADAIAGAPDLLLLDEPIEDLDAEATAWLCRWLSGHDGGVLVVSHHRGLLAQVRHFFVLEDAGAWYFRGTFGELERDLAERQRAEERRYVRKLHVLAEREQHDVRVGQRRQRKKRLGRLHEERRAPSRAQLHGKKGYAQASQGKAARIRQARIEGVRDWVRAGRRALEVRLPVAALVPTLPPADTVAVIALEGVCVNRGAASVLTEVSLRVGRDRLGVVGPNGAGKSTLLGVMRGERVDRGWARVRHERVGGVAQGASDWQLTDSLLDVLGAEHDAEAVAARVVAHRFPLGLAARPLCSLSAGERLRAALLCLFERAPEVLVLDEPTRSLDLFGVSALVEALSAWPGGLVVASHDPWFLQAIGVRRTVVLDGAGGHRIEDLRSLPMYGVSS